MKTNKSTLKQCKRCFTMKNIQINNKICKRCNDEKNKSKSSDRQEESIERKSALNGKTIVPREQLSVAQVSSTALSTFDKELEEKKQIIGTNMVISFEDKDTEIIRLGHVQSSKNITISKLLDDINKKLKCQNNFQCRGDKYDCWRCSTNRSIKQLIIKHFGEPNGK